MCVLHMNGPVPVALENISGRGAILRGNSCPEPGDLVRLQHPSAGIIDAVVSTAEADGIEVVFTGDETAVAFALKAIATDMTRA